MKAATYATKQITQLSSVSKIKITNKMTAKTTTNSIKDQAINKWKQKQPKRIQSK